MAEMGQAERELYAAGDMLDDPLQGVLISVDQITITRRFGQYARRFHRGFWVFGARRGLVAD